MEKLPSSIRDVLYFLNSRPMLKFLETLTGIQGVLPDPYYTGGGLHQIGPGACWKSCSGGYYSAAAVGRGKFPTVGCAHVAFFLDYAGFPSFQVGGFVSGQFSTLHPLRNPRLLVGFTLPAVPGGGAV